MKLTLTIQMDNDAFQSAREAPRILYGVARYLETNVQAGEMDNGQRLRDSNGNMVGGWMIREDDC